MQLREGHYDVVIIGGGIAGFTAAKTIAAARKGLRTAIITDEDRAPYKRTKISKTIAAGFATDSFQLQERSWYEGEGLDLAVGQRVSAIDASERRVRFEDGTVCSYGRLILAPGAEPFRVPAGTGVQSSVFVVRTAAQVERLRSAAGSGDSIAVIGNGVLGLEVAEQLSLMGAKIILIGSGERVLRRHVDDHISHMIERLLEEHGIEVISGEHVRFIDGKAGALEVAGSARTHRVSAAVCCIGVGPRLELPRSAGLVVARGIVVDDHLRTSDSSIYAAGDAAEHSDGSVSFLWHSAEYQGEVAARNAMGEETRYDYRPFRLKCELFGDYYFSLCKPSDPAGYETQSASAGPLYRTLYFREGRLSGAIMANDAARAKTYVRAVREGWEAARVETELPLAASEARG